MGKLRLNLDQLLVDSFDTAAPKAERGTVLGEQQCTCPTQCSCPGCPTCDHTACEQATCYTCDETCGGSPTECATDTLDAPTCNITYGDAPRQCCPY